MTLDFRRALCSLLCLALAGCGERAGSNAQQFEGATMGTYYRITALCDVAPLQSEAQALLDDFNATMSNYDPDSTLSRLNRSPIGAPQSVPADLLEVLVAARTVHAASDGAFDVTIAPLLRLWGFGPDAATQFPPADAAIAAAMEQVGMHYLRLDPQAQVLVRERNVELDLSALAKGYAVDVLSRWLAAKGCRDHLVDIGGEVRAAGRNRRGDNWRVGVEVPDPERRGAVQRVLHVSDAAVATSGDYRNFLRAGDTRWSHTLDPRSGRPVAHALASVTVVAADAMWADAWATALNVLGPERALAVARRENLAVLLISRDATGFKERYNDAFATYLNPAEVSR